MKKLLVILLLLVYGLSSTGMTVNFHYCCGKLKKIEFSSAQIECGMKKKHTSGKKCCDNKQVDLKVKGEQKITETAKTVLAVAVSNSFNEFLVSQPEQGSLLVPSVFAPPPLQNQHLYILHCTYRI